VKSRSVNYIKILGGGSNMKKRIWLMSVVVVLCFLFLADPGQGAPIRLKLGTVSPPASIDTIASKKMEELVDERSTGRLKIDVFPGTLGTGQTQLEGVMMGTLDLFVGAADFNSSFEKDYNILSVPFVFRDQKHLQTFFNSPLNAEIKERLRKNRGIWIMTENWNSTPRILLSKKPINSPEDLRGIKMRVPESEIYLKSWKALGTYPTQVPWGEAYLALMQGVVDAMDAPYGAALPMKFYEAAPNISLTNHVMFAVSVSMNHKKFLSLPKDLQDILLGAVRDAGDYFTKIDLDKYDKDRKIMESKGTKFIVVEQEPFRQIMKPLYKELEDQGKWSKGLYQKIQDLK
jgi:tripartite ATP-independent transporter DctP family solute receptor